MRVRQAFWPKIGLHSSISPESLGLLGKIERLLPAGPHLSSQRSYKTFVVSPVEKWPLQPISPG